MLLEKKRRSAVAVLCFVLTVALCSTMFPVTTYACEISGFEILKTDIDGKNADKMNGAKFKLYKQSGSRWIEQSTIKIGSNGKGTYGKLGKGTYKLEESEAAPGYDKDKLVWVSSSKGKIGTTGNDKGVFKVTDNDNKKYFTFTAKNDVKKTYGKIKLTKYGEKIKSGYELEDAKFLLKDSDGNAVGQAKSTNSKGVVEWTNLEHDTYTIEETSASGNYDKNSFKLYKKVNDEYKLIEDKKITINEENSGSCGYVEVKGTNEKIKGQAQLKKVDKKDNSIVLEGVWFELRDKDNRLVPNTKKQTNSDGIVTWGGLELDKTYKVVEVGSIYGYESGSFTLYKDSIKSSNKMDDKKFKLTKTKNEIFMVGTNTPKLGKIKLSKYEKGTANPLSGAAFALSQGGIIIDGSERKTDSNGRATWDNLRYGEYEVVEVSPAPGYNNDLILLDSSDKEITGNIVNVNTTCEIKVKGLNTIKTGKITLTKEDINDQSADMTGFTFKVMGDNSFEKDMVDNKDGTYSLEGLNPGNYWISEYYAPGEYDPGSLTFVTGTGVDEDGNFTIDNLDDESLDIKVTATNDVYRGTVRVVKYDSSNEDFVSEAKLYLKDADGNVVTTGSGAELTTYYAITDDFGTATWENLPKGTYSVFEEGDTVGYIVPEDGDLNVTITHDPRRENFGEASIFNDPKLGSIYVHKYDNHEQSISDVTFDLLLLENGLYTTVASLTTDRDGIASIGGLAWGDYRLVETGGPQGYDYQNAELMLNGYETDGYFSIERESVKEFEFNVLNKRLPGSLSIQKFDSALLGTVLSGAVFSLEKFDTGSNSWIPYTGTGSAVITATTNINGIATFDNLEWGKYRIIEDQAPTGYDKNTLTFGQGTNEFTVENTNLNFLLAAYNTKTVVYDETVTPPSGESGGDVLGVTEDPAGDEEGDVLGEEAKTSDSMSLMAYLFAMLAMLVLITGAYRKRREQ